MNEIPVSSLASSPPGLARRIFRSPPLRIIILGFILVLMLTLTTDILTIYATNPGKSDLHIIALAIAGFAIYLTYAHTVEQRDASELSTKGMTRELGIGLLIGAGLYTASVLVLMAMGVYKINGLNPWTLLLPAVSMAISSGVFEELLFRGVLFRSIETWFGTWAGLVVSSVAFGLVHLINPEATLEGAIFIAVEAGILLAAAYILTRRLWLSMGFHMAWNYTQSAVFSGIVSGNEAAEGLIQSTVKGPDILTGGKFGVESSIVALILCTSTGIALVILALKRGKFVPPIWKRQRSL
jgi:membrane protease YdiL (CAAX protease family)